MSFLRSLFLSLLFLIALTSCQARFLSDAKQLPVVERDRLPKPSMSARLIVADPLFWSILRSTPSPISHRPWICRLPAAYSSTRSLHFIRFFVITVQEWHLANYLLEQYHDKHTLLYGTAFFLVRSATLGICGTVYSLCRSRPDRSAFLVPAVLLMNHCDILRSCNHLERPMWRQYALFSIFTSGPKHGNTMFHHIVKVLHSIRFPLVENLKSPPQFYRNIYAAKLSILDAHLLFIVNQCILQ